MQWSNTLSNLALCSGRLWSTQSHLIPWKCFSVSLHHCVSYGLISQPMPQLENALNCSHSGSDSKGSTFLFLYSLLSNDFRKKTQKTLKLESSRPQPCGQYLRRTLPLAISFLFFLFLFFTTKRTLDWQPLAPEGEMPGWEVSSDNSWEADLSHFYSLERYSLKCFLVPPYVKWHNLATSQLSATPISTHPPSCWTNGRFSSVFLLKVKKSPVVA